MVDRTATFHIPVIMIDKISKDKDSEKMQLMLDSKMGSDIFVVTF